MYRNEKIYYRFGFYSPFKNTEHILNQRSTRKQEYMYPGEKPLDLPAELMCLKAADGMANSEDSDPTAPPGAI